MNNVSRRTLAKGAAWAAPVVISTAAIPAYAASPSDVCSSTSPATSITWANFVRDTPVTAQGSTSHSGSVTTNDGQAVLTITHTSSTGPSLSNSQNLITNKNVAGTVTWSSYSGLSNYLFFQSLQSGTNGYTGGNQKSTVTMSFSAPVTGFTFTIGDVDQASSGSGGPWQDVFTASSSLNGVATSAPVASGGATISTGATTTTFTANQNSLGPNSSAGNVTLSFPEPIDTVTLTLSNGSNRTGAQNFVIGGNTTLNVCSTGTTSN